MNKINIIFGASTFVSMKESSILNKIIEFDTVFSVADLKTVDNYEITLPKEMYKEYIKYSFRDKIQELDKIVNLNKEIRIWTSHYEINSYLLLLYICNYLKDKNCNIFVVFSEEYNKECLSPAWMKTEELENLFKFEHKLSKEDIEKYSNEWIKIKSINSNMRIMENKTVKSVSFNYYDKEILNRLKQIKNIKLSSFTASLMNDYLLSDIVFVYLINRLISQEKIKIVEVSEERFFENIIALNDKY